MPDLPLRPQFGSRVPPAARARAQAIADHVNRLIARDPAEHQRYVFATIARELKVREVEVWDAISDGRARDLQVFVSAEDRIALEPYRR